MESEQLARISETLEELLAWTRLQAINHARVALAKALPEDAQRVLYQASDGSSSSKVASIAGVSDVTVQRTWKRLFRAGLMKEDRSTKGRYIRTFDLADFDLLPAPSKLDGGPTTAKPLPSSAKAGKTAKPASVAPDLSG